MNIKYKYDKAIILAEGHFSNKFSVLLIHNSGIGQMIKVEEWEASSEMMTCAFRYSENAAPGN